jgi:hypothetical protein
MVLLAVWSIVLRLRATITRSVSGVQRRLHRWRHTYHWCVEEISKPKCLLKASPPEVQ